MASENDVEIKIKIYSQNGQFLIWNEEDAFKVRKIHRIVGTFIGSYPGEPFQINKNGLPLQLMREETRLLLELGVANLLQLKVKSGENVIESYNQHLETAREDYSKLATERRLEEINSHVGQSRGQKRKRDSSRKSKTIKSDSGSDNMEEKGSEKKKEKESLQTKNSDLFPVQLFTECPWPRDDEVINDKWSYPQREHEKLLYSIFKDLWKRGHYLTSGFKFGCDYLVYEYDPLVIHAKYMVKCRSQNEDITGLQILILSRLSSQVNKQLLIASLISNIEANDKDSMNNRVGNDESNSKPTYLSIDWEGNQDSPFMRSNNRPNFPI